MRRVRWVNRVPLPPSPSVRPICHVSVRVESEVSGPALSPDSWMTQEAADEDEDEDGDEEVERKGINNKSQKKK